MSSPSQSVTVLGAGSWGATLAGMLAEKGQSVRLWEFDAKAAQTLAKTRRLGVLPDLHLPENVTVVSNLDECLGDALLIAAVPSHFMRSTFKAVKKSRSRSEQELSVISVSKGLEEQTFKTMSEIVTEELGRAKVAVLSGPSHAEEVCRKLPTALVIAGGDQPLIERGQALFSTDYLRVYEHTDPHGVQLGGALKNVYAIGCGISDGLGFGDNARAAIMTRGLNEMVRIGVKAGADLLTFFGLAGMGDLVVTCMSRHSRNHLLGEKIGAGKSVAQALSEMTMVAEGYKTASSAYRLAQRFGLDCPLTREIYEVLYENKNPRSSLRDLMSREAQTEWQSLPAVGRLAGGE